MPAPGSVIVAQPADAEASLGEELVVSVEAKGKGLKYQWYYRNPGMKNFAVSDIRTNTYAVEMTRERAGREICCVVTDALGNRIQTDTVTLVVKTK